MFLILFFLSLSISAVAQQVYIFGGENRNIYLGCITCSQFHDESIWNKSGMFGTKNNNISIWSEFSDYGNEYSNYSPWNEFASRPPVLYDDDGNFYGYFTRNAYYKDRTEVEFFLFVLENYRWITNHFDEFVNKLNF